MKKFILASIIIIISSNVYSQKIGIKFKKQDITIEAPIIVNIDTIGVRSIIDDGSSVVVILSINTRVHDLTLWVGQDYIKHQNWSNDDILDRIKQLLNIK